MMKSRLRFICLAMLLLQAAPGYSLGDTQFSLGSSSTQFTSRLASSKVAVILPLGVTAGYSYRQGLFQAIYLQYQLVSSSSKIVLYGLTGGLDYTILGGQTKTLQGTGDTAYEFRFPYRLGLFFAMAQRSYNLSGFYPQTLVTFQKSVTLAGTLLGLESGLALESRWNQTLSLMARASLTMPVFMGEPAQKGSLLTFGFGFGLLL